MQEMINKTRALRTLMQSDPHRPIYHFVAPEGHAFPFDPNGAIYWKGKYHLGFIYQKLRSEPITLPGTDYVEKFEHVWGHAVSTDLLHWTLYPDMLDVKEGDIEIGIYSGGAFLSKEGIPHIIYHGQGAHVNMLAYSTDDDLKVWNKFDGNPVLKTPDVKGGPFDASAEYVAWDPEAWYDKKAGVYYQISGGLKPVLFKSKDMYKWDYLGDLIDKDNTMRHPFEDVSCPDFFSLGDKSMLLFISHSLGTQYYIGEFSEDKFTPEQHGRMNWPGGTFFAPEQLQDDKGRNIIWGWVVQPRELEKVFNEGKESPYPDYGWSGIMSLPRVVSLDSQGTLQITPPEEMKTIRLNEVREDDIVLQPNKESLLKANGKSIELKLEIAGGGRSAFGVKVFASPDGREETIIRYEPAQEQLVIDFVNSSINGPVFIPGFILNPTRNDSFNGSFEQFDKNVSEQRAPLKLKKNETLKLDIFLDRSVIEVFANGRQVVTQVVYPELKTSTAVKVFSGAEKITVKNIQSWKMAETNAY